MSRLSWLLLELLLSLTRLPWLCPTLLRHSRWNLSEPWLSRLSRPLRLLPQALTRLLLFRLPSQLSLSQPLLAATVIIAAAVAGLLSCSCSRSAAAVAQSCYRAATIVTQRLSSRSAVAQLL